jgi:pyruvate,water dikinase
VCAAETADAAFDRLAPGDILVTRTTTPAYNTVLTLVGGLVTGEGGPMSHAAVLSRELGLPAVIGVGDGFEALLDAMVVEVDPRAGTVRILDDAPPGT